MSYTTRTASGVGHHTTINVELQALEDRLADLIEEHLAKMPPEEAQRRLAAALAVVVSKKPVGE